MASVLVHVRVITIKNTTLCTHHKVSSLVLGGEDQAMRLDYIIKRDIFVRSLETKPNKNNVFYCIQARTYWRELGRNYLKGTLNLTLKQRKYKGT